MNFTINVLAYKMIKLQLLKISMSTLLIIHYKYL